MSFLWALRILRRNQRRSIHLIFSLSLPFRSDRFLRIIHSFLSLRIKCCPQSAISDLYFFSTRSCPLIFCLSNCLVLCCWLDLLWTANKCQVVLRVLPTWYNSYQRQVLYMICLHNGFQQGTTRHGGGYILN